MRRRIEISRVKGPRYLDIESSLLQIADFERRMDTLTLEHREKYRGAKIQLEREIQTLQQELQQLKATCIINSEKIDYNFQASTYNITFNLIIFLQENNYNLTLQ